MFIIPDIMEEEEINQTSSVMTNLCTCALALSKIADYVREYEGADSVNYQDATGRIIDAQSAATDAAEEITALSGRLQDVKENEVKALKDDLSAARDTVRRSVEDIEKMRGWMYKSRDEAGHWEACYKNLHDMVYDRMTPGEQERHEEFVKNQREKK